MCHQAQHRPGILRTHYAHQSGAFVQAGFVFVTGMESPMSVQSQLERWVFARLDPKPSFTSFTLLCASQSQPLWSSVSSPVYRDHDMTYIAVRITWNKPQGACVRGCG